jgi:hypothetical protein
MPNYNTVSAKSIVAKVYRDLGVEDESWEIDAIEWIGEALEKMGVAPAYEEREEIFAVQDHKMAMPTGVMQMRGLWKAESVDYTVNSDGTVNVDQQALADKTKRRVPRKKGAGRTLRKGVGPSGTVTPEVGGPGGDYYILNPGYLHTSFEKGLVILGYRGIKTDDDGYPLVPDEANSDEAMFWYIMYKLLTRQPTIHPQMNWQNAQKQWEKHKHRAKTKIKMPDPDEYEHFQQTWVHMIQPKRPGRRQQQLIAGGTYQGSDLIENAPIDNF